MLIDYDREADVLYVSFKRPQKATDSEMLDNGVLLRYREDELCRCNYTRGFKNVCREGYKMLTRLSDNETIAIEEFQKNILSKFGNTDFILFGSKARGDGDHYSDLDILVLLEQEINISIEEEIIDIGYEIELKYDVALGLLIHSKAFWNSKGILMPINKEIERDGIQI